MEVAISDFDRLPKLFDDFVADRRNRSNPAGSSGGCCMVEETVIKTDLDFVKRLQRRRSSMKKSDRRHPFGLQYLPG
jgi:hypothetical protein